MVTREDPEPAGVLRQDGGDAELRREVADRRRLGPLELLVPERLGEIFLQVRGRSRHLRDEPGIGRQPVEFLRGQRGEQADRVRADLVPAPRIQGCEHVPGRLVPRPAEVAGELPEGRDRCRENRSNSKTTDCSHDARLPAPYPIDAPPVAGALQSTQELPRSFLGLAVTGRMGWRRYLRGIRTEPRSGRRRAGCDTPGGGCTPVLRIARIRDGCSHGAPRAPRSTQRPTWVLPEE